MKVRIELVVDTGDDTEEWAWARARDYIREQYGDTVQLAVNYPEEAVESVVRDVIENYLIPEYLPGWRLEPHGSVVKMGQIAPIREERS